MTEACNDENAPLRALSAVCSAVRLFFWLFSSEIGSDAIFCARVMTWAKSLENVLLPVKIELVALLIRISQNAGPALASRPGHITPTVYSGRRDYPRSSERTACGAELACAIAAMDACTRTCALVRFAASDATSVSRIRDSAAEKP